MTYDELTSALLRTEVERDEARAIARRLRAAAYRVCKERHSDFDEPSVAELRGEVAAFDALDWSRDEWAKDDA